MSYVCVKIAPKLRGEGRKRWKTRKRRSERRQNKNAIIGPWDQNLLLTAFSLCGWLRLTMLKIFGADSWLRERTVGQTDKGVPRGTNNKREEREKGWRLRRVFRVADQVIADHQSHQQSNYLGWVKRVTLFESLAHLKVDASCPLESRLVPGFPARLLNSGQNRCSFEVVLSRRKAFEGTRPSWASWLVCLAIFKGYFQVGLSKGNDR